MLNASRKKIGFSGQRIRENREISVPVGVAVAFIDSASSGIDTSRGCAAEGYIVDALGADKSRTRAG